MSDTPGKETLDVKACVKVVEGGVPETTALLKVFFRLLLYFPLRVASQSILRSALTTFSTLAAHQWGGLLGRQKI